MTEDKKDFRENTDRETPSLKSLMGGLFKINGYKASAILTCDGEVLYDTTPPQTSGNFGAWMTVFNNLFDHTCNLSEASGFFGCQQISMRTGDEIVIIRSSGQHCLIGLRLLVIIDHHGNVATVHQKLDELLPPIMRHLALDADNLIALAPEKTPSNDRTVN